MFIKRLRFSILSLLLILIANNCFLSFANVITNYETTGWTLHDSNTYPPKVNDERYLYFAGKTSDLRGLKIEVKTIPTVESATAVLTSASVAFEYWGYGGDPTSDTDGYSATTLFSLGASFQSEARPQTVWAAFNESFLGNKVGDLWGEFEATSNEPVYPARIMITPIPMTSDQDYYVALKGIQVNYYFTENVSVPVGGADLTDLTENATETYEYQTVNQTVTLTCDSNSCDDFVLTSGVSYYWSDLYLPTKPTNFSNFYTPDTATSGVMPYSVTLNKTEEPEQQIYVGACFKFSYWITEGAHVMVNLANGTNIIVLTATYAKTNGSSKYEWYSTEFCLSQFFIHIPTGQYKISFIPSVLTPPDYIAISQITEADARGPPVVVYTKSYFESWSRSSVKGGQFFASIPPNATFATTDDSMIIQSVAPGNGIIYLMSTWFEMVEGLELRATISTTSCPSAFNVSMQVLDDHNSVFDSQSSDLCEASSATSTKIYPIPVGDIGEGYKIQFTISYDEKTTTKHNLTISALDLGDACRRDRGECSDHGTCSVVSPNIANCTCDTGYLTIDEEAKCNKPDWCVLTFTLDDATETNGTDYCDDRAGACNSTTFDPDMRRICDCGATAYWKYESTLGHACADFDPCTGIDAFCPVGYTCAVGTESVSCSACDTENGYVNDTTLNKCVKSNPCDANPCISGAECKSDPNGVAVCYCTNGIVYDTTTGCDLESCSYDDRKSLGCEQSCTVELGNAECTCFSGYNLTEGSTTACEQLEDFNCTADCSKLTGSICVLDENNESDCTCLPGYVMIDSACVDICKGAALNDSEAVSQVKLICGTSRCTIDSTDALTCECDVPYTVGSDKRCHIDTTCLAGGKGYSDCSARGAICQPNLQAVEYNGNPWKCVCPIGTSMASNGSCVDQCMDAKTCLFDNAVCQRSTNLTANTYECVCQPGLKKGTDNRCYLIEHSLRVEMVVRLEEAEITEMGTELEATMTNYYMSPAVTDTCSSYASLDISGCVDYLTQSAQEKAEMQKPAAMEAAIQSMLKTTLKSDLANVYGSTFGDINVINYTKILTSTNSLGGDYRAVISIELTDPTINTTRLTLFNDVAICHEFPETLTEATGYCFIPTSSVILRNSINESDLMPCNETYIDYCPANTQCKSLNYSRFSCSCNSGFRAETIIQMDETARNEYYKEYCEDIDECSMATSPCREHSTCINTIGSYMCPCNHEYIEDTTTGLCIDVCSAVNCVNGECYVVANNTGACRCNEGYIGETCEDQDPMVTTFRTALIAVAVVLGLLLIVVVLVAVILIKKTKRSAMQKNAERPMAEYGRPQVPKRYEDNSGFTND